MTTLRSTSLYIIIDGGPNSPDVIIFLSSKEIFVSGSQFIEAVGHGAGRSDGGTRQKVGRAKKIASRVRKTV